MNMHINREEPQRQHREHKLRQERLGGMARRKEWLRLLDEPADVPAPTPAPVPVAAIAPAPEPEPVSYHDHGFDLHVSAWREAMWEKPQVDMRPTVGKIIATVCEFYGIPKVELLAHRRLKSFAKARQVAMYLSRELTTKSLPVIGAAIGGRDHTTILHGVGKISAEIETNARLASEVETIRLKLIGGDDADATGA
ncbi:Chromosomal replication initiator DnaA domain [Xanthobacter versatilis]|uniref:Chromosomal replication initiator DnaA domain n=1 Tax=Xanthobacter autotrophicus (strain ATCC BAA-1158 / Py2) TaxID=78245 RepID=A7ILN1_XANP2|nr:Chromosomal replication initiator DnaA domain [Xanthobacter autotrophicus Py2]